MDDGSRLLTSPDVGELLHAAVEHAGGRLESWRLDHVDSHPNHSTTATYSAVVAWRWGERAELLGVSARAGGLTTADGRAAIFGDGDRQVAVWLYPNDPDLPGLQRAAYPEQMAQLITEFDLVGRPIGPDELTVQMIGYRPRRRAVVRLRIPQPGGGRVVFYVKVLRAGLFDDVARRHALLAASPVPGPEVVAATDDHLLVLRELPGAPLARAIFDPVSPCRPEDLVAVLDAIPPAVAGLERRPPWTDAVPHYAEMIAQTLPEQRRRLEWLSRTILDGVGHLPPGDEPTHGDFHEGQVHVADGRVVGVLDIDTMGPGRRADDLACLVAHLSTVQRMNAQQAARVRDLIRSWVPVFDQRVDPAELRLRAAAVIVSLATGPYRGQEPQWERDTVDMLDAAEALVRQVR